MAQRTTVPPRRDAIIQQYQHAHEMAFLAKDEAEKLEDWAEKAHDRRDYRAASHFWDRSIRHTDTSRGHRERELALRKEEYSLYNHLDQDEKRTGLYKLIGYCERRIERLRTDMSKRLCKSRIAYLKEGIVHQEMKARGIEKQIIEKDLHVKAKGRSNISFGNGWDDMREGWGPRQPERRDVKYSVQSYAADQLSYLDSRRDDALRRIEQSIEEIRSNETEWENIKEQERAREDQWSRLDADARRHWSSLPTNEYETPALEVLEQKRKEKKQARLLEEAAEQERQERMRNERAAQQKELEERQQAERAQRVEEQTAIAHKEAEDKALREKQEEEQARWEEDYALEEDPDFLNPPNRAKSPKDPEQSEEDMTSAPSLQHAPEEANVLDLISSALPKNRPFLNTDDGWQMESDQGLSERETMHYSMQSEEQTNEDISFAMEYLEENVFADPDNDGHVHIDYRDGIKV